MNTPLPQVCERCGKVSPSSAIGLAPGASVTLEGILVVSPCPYCGGQARIPEGRYESVRAIVEAIRSPEVTRAELERLRAIAKGVSKGTTDDQQATNQVDELSAPLARVWSAFGTGQAQLLAAVISIILMLYFQHGAEEETARERILSQQTVQIEQRIFEELQKTQQSALAAKKPTKPKAPTRKSPQRQIRAANRSARREEAAWKRRQKPRGD